MEDYRLVAERRTSTGKKETKLLRAEGRVPANIYGFKKDGASVSITADDINKVIAKGSKVVDVELDGNVDKAMAKLSKRQATKERKFLPTSRLAEE